MDDLFKDAALMLISYVYIFFVIFISDRAEKNYNFSKKTARKILHVLTGNLILILPFYSYQIFPLMVAFPFIFITFLASPYSPVKSLRNKLSLIGDKTEIGHPLGLVYYSFSFTVLTALFFDKRYIIATGVMPMAYGDAAAALIGERYGKWKYKIFADKSVTGSLGMLFFSFLSVACSLSLYSFFYSFQAIMIFTLSLYVSLLATIIEALSPRGVDNIFVPLMCATLSFLMVK